MASEKERIKEIVEKDVIESVEVEMPDAFTFK